MSITSIDPLSEFLDQINSDQDKVLFLEAVNAAKGGAFRAAYIMVWLACAESLKRRFQELAVRDARATGVVAQIAEKESNNKSIDRFLIERASEYGILDEAGTPALTYIYTMRCIYGHPYEKQPDIEQLRAAAHDSVKNLLSFPTKLGEGFIAEQVRRITSERTYLDDSEHALASYAKEMHEKIADAKQAYFLHKLWKVTEPFVLERTSHDFVSKAVRISRYFLSLSPEEILRTMNPVEELTATPFMASSTYAEHNAFSLLNEHAQDIVVGRTLEYCSANVRYLRQIENLSKRNLLTVRQKERFLQALESRSLNDLRNAGVSPELYSANILTELKVLNWYRQNPAVSALNDLGPDHVSSLSPEFQVDLGRSILAAADGNSTAAIEFVSELATLGRAWPEFFIEGVISECMINESGEIRFKTKFAEKALESIVILNAGCQVQVINRIVESLKRGRLKASGMNIYDDEHCKLLNVLATIVGKDTEKYKALGALIAPLKAIVVPANPILL